MLKEASNVFRSVQRQGSRRNEVICHAEARCLSREKVLEPVFQLRQKLRVFLAQKGHPLSINFQGNFWLYLNLNSLLCIVQPFTDEELDLGYTLAATKTQKTAMTQHTELNESWSCSLRNCTTPSADNKNVCEYKKTYLIYYECCRWFSFTSCEKRGFNPVSRDSLIRGSTSLIEFAFSFYFDKSRKPLQRWVVSMRTKAEIAFWLRFWCSGMLISDIQKRPRQRLLHRKNRWSFCTFTELYVGAWQRCTGQRANFKVCTNIKKVDNHWSSTSDVAKASWYRWTKLVQSTASAQNRDRMPDNKIVFVRWFKKLFPKRGNCVPWFWVHWNFFQPPAVTDPYTFCSVIHL